MLARSLGPTLALALVASLPAPASAQANGTGIREVSATGRSLITLQTRLRYTTMVLLPDGEEILDVICGDRDFWVITATHNIAHVKPAKAGAETNLNLVTSSGAIYSFMLTEKSSPPDIKVYVQSEEGGTTGTPKYYSAAQVQTLEAQVAELRAAARELIAGAVMPAFDARFVLVVTSTMLLGLAWGVAAAGHVAPARLRRGFGWLVLGVAAATAFQQLA